MNQFKKEKKGGSAILALPSDMDPEPTLQNTLSSPYPDPRGTLCPLTKITAYLQNDLEFGVTSLWLFSRYFPFRKVQFHQSALTYVAMATIQLFGLFLKTWIAIVIQVFPPERNFVRDNLICFGYHNTLRSLIKANICTVPIERFNKMILPKYGHQH